MKTKLIFIAFLFLSISMSAQWKPAGDKIKLFFLHKTLSVIMECKDTIIFIECSALL